MQRALILLLILGMPMIAQTRDNDGEELVSVPKKYVSTEGLAHQSSQSSEWIGIGREIGLATREGLDAVVDTTGRFGATKVGTFVMAMIAWKIMAKDVLGVILGIPLLFTGAWMWAWIAKRLFFGYRVIDKIEGKIKTYKDHEAYSFSSSDARATAGAALVASGVAFTLVMLAIIF